jgi:hypothetical protein
LPLSIYYQYQNQNVNGLREPFKRIMRVMTSEKPLSRLDKIRLARDLITIMDTLKQMPKPDATNITDHNGRILVGIRDRFFRRFDVPSIGKELEKFVDFGLIIRATDFYKSFMDWWVEELRASDWRPLGPFQPDPHFFKPQQDSEREKDEVLL